MTAETADPVVAAVYGALAYPSLRPGVTTAADLVAGQPGPWVLADEDRAVLAEQLVARLRSTTATPVGAPSAVLELGKAVVDACRTAQALLAEFWSAHRDNLPAHLNHEIETVEGRLVEFIDHNPQGIPTPPPPAPAPTPAALPTVEEAVAMRNDQWIVFLRDRGLAVPDALRDLRARAEAIGKVPPMSLRDVHGNPYLAGILLTLAAEANKPGPRR